MNKILIAIVAGLWATGPADGNNSLAVDLHKILKPATENEFFSPLSISAALGMTEAGAKGATSDEMRKALHMGDDAKRHETLGALLKSLGGKTLKANGYELAIANRLFPQKGLKLVKAFEDVVKTHFGAALDGVDYVGDPEAARIGINKWVEAQTREKIKDLFPQGTITPDTRLVLANAIYFKGNWETQFEKDATGDEDFFVGKDSTVKVPLMFQKSLLGYVQTDAVKAVELPFKQNEISFVVIVPREKFGLAKFEETLTPESMAKLLGGLKRDDKVTVRLPRFKMECSFSLNDPLQKLGMSTAFTPGSADFTGITTEARIHISTVVHKAFIEVNEEGAEAAAATGVGMELSSAPVDPKVVRADHPFIFLIRDVKSGTILFQGRFVKP